MTEADRLQGFPKIHKESQTDGQGRNGQRTIRGESKTGNSSVHTWGKVVGGSLLLCVSSSLAGFSLIEVFRAWVVIIIFFRAGSVGLHFYAFLSEFSQGNSSW